MKKDARTLLATSAGILFVIVIGGYAYLKTKNLVEGPVIAVLSPTDGELVTSARVELSGVSKNVSRLTVNDRPIYVDESGRFSDTLVVPEGYTIITVIGTDRFGKSKREEIRVVRKDDGTAHTTATTTGPGN